LKSHRRSGKDLTHRIAILAVAVSLLVTSFDHSLVLAKESAARAANTYHNPIIPEAVGGADPTVIKFQGKYYLYPTLDGRGYDVFVSEDLVHWERKPKCYRDHRHGLWAPDVFHDIKGSGHFFLYYSANNPEGGKVVGVAESASPLGPFENKGDLVKHAIDATVFQDTDGVLYFYYVDLAHGSTIRGQRMNDPLKLKGEPTEMLYPTEDWEKKKGSVTEGPWMLKHNDTYYLMYSGSGADGPDYGIGYATAKSPLGPFRKYPGNPIVHRGNGVLGPGHHCVIEGPHGGLWMVYHQKASTNIGWDRFLAIDPLSFDQAGVIHATPTRGTEQPVP
jgi:beta-xylosidase